MQIAIKTDIPDNGNCKQCNHYNDGCCLLFFEFVQHARCEACILAQVNYNLITHQFGLEFGVACQANA